MGLEFVSYQNSHLVIASFKQVHSQSVRGPGQGSHESGQGTWSHSLAVTGSSLSSIRVMAVVTQAWARALHCTSAITRAVRHRLPQRLTGDTLGSWRSETPEQSRVCQLKSLLQPFSSTSRITVRNMLTRSHAKRQEILSLFPQGCIGSRYDCILWHWILRVRLAYVEQSHASRDEWQHIADFFHQDNDEELSKLFIEKLTDFAKSDAL